MADEHFKSNTLQGNFPLTMYYNVLCTLKVLSTNFDTVVILVNEALLMGEPSEAISAGVGCITRTNSKVGIREHLKNREGKRLSGQF